MKLNIFSPRGIEYQDEALSLNIKTKSGEITLLDHHHPIITILEKGEATIRQKNGDMQKIMVYGGFLEMNRENELTVLTHTPHGKNP